VAHHLIDINDLDPAPYLPPPSHETVRQRPELFGTRTKISGILLAPMATPAKRRSARWVRIRRWRALGSSAARCTTTFKQVFAQVTNPPLDAIREELVTSMEVDDRAGRQPARSTSGIVAGRS
jgi:glutamate synthase (ferredoxin)